MTRSPLLFVMDGDATAAPTLAICTPFWALRRRLSRRFCST